MKLIEYQLTRIGLCMFCGFLPVSILIPTMEAAPRWAQIAIGAICLTYIIYVSAWSTITARQMVFDSKTYAQSSRPARQILNSRIVVFLAMLPIVGPWVAQLFKLNKSDEKD